MSSFSTMVRDLRAMFNNADSKPDLTIFLPNRSHTRLDTYLVHKNIICENSAHFRKVLRNGPNGYNSTHILIDTMPKATLLLLRECYGHPFPHRDAESFDIWAMIAFAPELEDVRNALREQAKQNLIAIARNQINVDRVRGLIIFLESCQWRIVGEVSNIIRKHHATKLLRDPHYWNEVRNDKDLLWLHRDDLVPKTDNNPNTAPDNNVNGVPNGIPNYNFNFT